MVETSGSSWISSAGIKQQRELQLVNHRSNNRRFHNLLKTYHGYTIIIVSVTMALMGFSHLNKCLTTVDKQMNTVWWLLIDTTLDHCNPGEVWDVVNVKDG